MLPYPGIARFSKPLIDMTQWSGREMDALGCVTDPAHVATISNSLASPTIPFTEALFGIKNLVYFHLIAPYRYHTEDKTKYMENYLQDFHHYNDIPSQFHTSQSTNKVSEDLKKQRSLDKQEEWEWDPAWKRHSAAAEGSHIDEDTTQMESEIAQHLVDESDFNFVNMHLLNHFFDHIWPVGNNLNASSDLPERVMMDLKQAYGQSNCHDLAYQIQWAKARKEVVHYREQNVKAAKQHRHHEITLTKVPIKRMMKNLQPETKTLDGLAEWCAMPTEEIKNQIAWCFEWFADVTDYVDQNQYFCHPNVVTYIRYKAVAIPVTPCQCNEYTVRMVGCTGFTW